MSDNITRLPETHRTRTLPDNLRNVANEVERHIEKTGEALDCTVIISSPEGMSIYGFGPNLDERMHGYTYQSGILSLAVQRVHDCAGQLLNAIKEEDEE